MKRMKKKLGMVILLCMLIGLFEKPAYAAEEPSFLYAKSAVLMDASSGRVLYGKNETKQMPMASTTKIMTCILALEHGELTDVVTVSDKAASMPKVHLGMRSGEQYVLKDLLYSLMLESHNDSAVAIAEHISGSVENFAKMMNQKAEEIGCENTHFVTPNGLDGTSEDGKIHATTATDLAKIMSYCILHSDKRKEFLEITQTSYYGFGEQSKGKRNFQCQNHNALLQMLPGTISGKTGYTSKAGYCYVGALESEGRYYVVALLACGWPNHKTYKWSDSKVLLEYGKAQFQPRNTSEAKYDVTIPGRIKVEGASGSQFGNPVYVDVVCQSESEDVSVLARKEEHWDVTLEISPYLTAPVKTGQIVGEVTYSLDDVVYKKDTIRTACDIKMLDMYDCMESIWKKYSFS